VHGAVEHILIAGKIIMTRFAGPGARLMLKRCFRTEQSFIFQRSLRACLAGFLMLATSPLWAQAFEPSVTIGAGIQSSYQHTEPTGGTGIDNFSLNHARIYLGGDVTKQISVMFNTEYNSGSNNMQILDAVGEYAASPKFNIWFGRFIPPSDRANFHGPFYANEWETYQDGIQGDQFTVFQGRDNGALYWGDFKAGTATVKVSVGAFDGISATRATNNPDARVIWAGRVQIDFWDPENGYYLNGTYYGDKNLLAVGGATNVQAGKTASTVDFLLERKVLNGGAVTLESEYSDYNRFGGGDGNYSKSQGAYGLASFLFPKPVGMGKFEILGKYGIAQFTDGLIVAMNPNYRQNTAEVNLNYVIKQFDARVLSFYRDYRFNGVNANTWAAGIGLQLQISKTIH
jgi:hypothetical protein